MNSSQSYNQLSPAQLSKDYAKNLASLFGGSAEQLANHDPLDTLGPALLSQGVSEELIEDLRQISEKPEIQSILGNINASLSGSQTQQPLHDEDSNWDIFVDSNFPGINSIEDFSDLNSGPGTGLLGSFSDAVTDYLPNSIWKKGVNELQEIVKELEASKFDLN